MVSQFVSFGERVRLLDSLLLHEITNADALDSDVSILELPDRGEGGIPGLRPPVSFSCSLPHFFPCFLLNFRPRFLPSVGTLGPL